MNEPMESVNSKISLDELDTKGSKAITKSIQNFKMATQTT